MKVSITAAIGQNRELGKNNRLLWHLPEDLKRFKKLTTNHVVIMGRKTFESIGRPLPNRTNIVVTRDKKYQVPNCIIAHSLKEACAVAEQKGETETFVIGGGEIYRQAIGIADKLYLTIVDARFAADTFFPDYSEFKKVVFEERHENKNYSYTFLELVRK